MNKPSFKKQGKGRAFAQNRSARRLPAGQDSPNENHRAQMPPSAAMREQFIRLNRRREKQRTIGMATIVLASLTIVIILISIVSGRSGKKEQMQFINMGTIESRFPARALIIRQEQLLPADRDGLVEPIISEGHRVGKDGLVARLLPPAEEELQAELKQVNQEIDRRRRDLLLAGLEPEAAHLSDLFTDRINTVAGGLRKEATANRLQDSEGYLNAVNLLLDEQNNTFDRLTSRDEQLQGLLNRRSDIQNQINASSSPLFAPQSGLVSYKSDGLEGELKPATAGQIQPGDFANYMAGPMTPLDLPARTAAGEPAVRLVTDIKQRLLVDVPGLTVDAAKQLPDRPRLVLKEPDIQLQQCTIERIIPAGDHAMLLMSTDEALEQLLTKRKVTGELQPQQITGLKIPRRALIMADQEGDVARIRLVRKSYIAEEAVQIKATERDAVIVEPLDPNSNLQAGDILIVNPESVKEGQRIE